MAEKAPVELWAAELLSSTPLLEHKIIENLACENQESIFESITETLKFLYLCKLAAPKPLTPSKRIDAIWHEFILFTRSYQIFCDKKIGQFIHHQPSLSVPTERQQYEHTLALYQQHFGHPNQAYWRNSNKPIDKDPQLESSTAACGTCEN